MGLLHDWPQSHDPPAEQYLAADTRRPVGCSLKLKRRAPSNDHPLRWYRGADIPMRVIRRYAQRVAERFDPDKIILFGSYAYGSPHVDSDVDILVIVQARNELDQAVKIRLEVPSQFPMDLLVLKPANEKEARRARVVSDRGHEPGKNPV
jgi:predicted nucleotidyltransferase